MVKRIGGNRRKTRSLFRKKPRNRGKFSITNYFQDFKKGDKVSLKAEPSIHKGMHYKRFDGKFGTVEKKQGKCYVVKIKDINKEKEYIIHPVHLKRIKK